MRYINTLTLALSILLTTGAHAQVITAFAGAFGNDSLTNDDGPAVDASLNWPVSLAIDSAGGVYIADLNNNVVRYVFSDGIITYVAGNYTPGYYGDGTSADIARMDGPSGIALDRQGNYYISDRYNHVVRKVVISTGIISTYAGNGYGAAGGTSPGPGGYSGDGGPATNAEFFDPVGLAVDNAGDLYITDAGNSTVRKVNSAGIISTVVGNGSGAGYSGDGGAATAAKLNQPMGIAVDNAGNLYIADQENNVIRMVSASGAISTFAGTGFGAGTSSVPTGGYTGDGGPAGSAELNWPAGVWLDASGNVYIADQANSAIRKVNASGTISTIAGNGTPGFAGNGGSARSAELRDPAAVAVDASGNIYIADMENSVVRKVFIDSVAASVGNVSQQANKLQVFQNPNNGTFSVAGSIGQITDPSATIEVLDMKGQVVYHASAGLQNGQLNTTVCLDAGLPSAEYILQAVSGSQRASVPFVVQR